MPEAAVTKIVVNDPDVEDRYLLSHDQGQVDLVQTLGALNEEDFKLLLEAIQVAGWNLPQQREPQTIKNLAE